MSVSHTRLSREQREFVEQLRPMGSFHQRAFIYAIGFGGLATAGLWAAQRAFPRIMGLSRSVKFAIITGLAVAPGGAAARLEQRSHNRKMSELLSKHHLDERQANLALQEKETFASDTTLWLYNHRAEFVIGFGTLGILSGMYTANKSTYMSNSAKAIRVRLFFSMAATGCLLFLCIISALTEESPKQRRRRSVKIE